MARKRRRWTKAEERWMASHAGDGVSIVAELLNRETHEVINHADFLGISLAVIPVRGMACPWCGKRMTFYETGYRKAGICDACYAQVLRDAREVKDHRDAMARDDDKQRQRDARSR